MRWGWRSISSLALARKALEALASLPKDILLTVNFSPATIMAPAFAELFNTLPLERVVLEVTEHAAVANYIELAARLHPFRNRGLRLAVDDAGAGHSSFRHVLDLRPDTIKLDMSLTRNIDRDHGRQALAGALAMFGRAMGSQIVAEGVETEAELDALRRVGVTKVQGYLTGRPMPLEDALKLTGLPQQGAAQGDARLAAVTRPTANPQPGTALIRLTFILSGRTLVMRAEGVGMSTDFERRLQGRNAADSGSALLQAGSSEAAADFHVADDG